MIIKDTIKPEISVIGNILPHKKNNIFPIKIDKKIEIFEDIAIIHSHLTVYLTFLEGASSIASEGAIQNNVSEGKYLDVLRRQEDGSWKCLVHTWKQIS